MLFSVTGPCSFVFFVLPMCSCECHPLTEPVFLFVFTERPKECVWWGDIGRIGAPRAQEETQMCAAMRASYPFQKCTHTTHLWYTHKPPTSLPQHPFSCSAKAGWQACSSVGGLERRQPTKWQMNNDKLHLQVWAEATLANALLWADLEAALTVEVEMTVELLIDWF